MPEAAATKPRKRAPKKKKSAPSATSMKFHVVSLPHTQTTREYSNCAFATLTRGFCQMMKSLGHEVVVYSGEDNDAPCDEHVVCINKDTQQALFNVEGPEDILKYPLAEIMYQPERPWWPLWNQSVWAEMQARVQPGDILCLIGGGVLFEPLISNAHAAGVPAVEYAIGYAGVSQRTFHGYGSSNWQHVVYGLRPPADWSGNFYDRVIPHYFDPDDFEFRAEKGDYFLYLGKLKQDKGVNLAAQACRAAGVKFIAAGQGPTPVEYGEVLNRRIGPDERRELLAGARGVFVPSLYVEPFGMIAVEALLSGTPIITTPWGGLGDINIDGVTGFKCNTMQDFVDAIPAVADLEPKLIYEEGMKYSFDVVRHQYERWFRDILGLRGEGWGALRG